MVGRFMRYDGEKESVRNEKSNHVGYSIYFGIGSKTVEGAGVFQDFLQRPWISHGPYTCPRY